MNKHSIVTIGVFDGVHIGHRAVVERAVRRARELGMKSAALTFDPHPMKVINRYHYVPSLISLKHRIGLLRGLGIDRVVVVKFDKRLASMSPEEFIRRVVMGRVFAAEIFVGEDFSFGRGARAGVEAMKAIGKRFGLKVNAVKHVKKSGRIVSSSLIRRLVVAGRTNEAGRLLGRPYSVLGTVVKGAALARLLGYPTANINPHHEAVPPSGVYAVKVGIGNRLYKGVLNIGVRPTFYNHGHDMEPSIEAHIFGFSGRIYGKDIEIIFVKKIRDEKKFKTPTALIKQIEKDEKSARRILS